MGFIKGFGSFWYDFLIGDDWKIAAGVVLILAVGAGIVVSGYDNSGVLTALLALGIAAAFSITLLIDVRRSSK
jgi:voltage-gated potassium channel Kch